jgi:hypothetical protein
LTLEDLDAAAALMEQHYYGGTLGTYLSCVFMNSSFVQPNESAAKTQSFVSQYLRAHRAAPHSDVTGLRCVFSGEPATSPLVRTHLPMFSGEGVMNFRPDGGTFVPAAGAYVVALMFSPLASRRAEGRMLCVLTDDAALTLRFAKRYLEDNRRLLQMALPTAKAPVHPEFEREQPMWDATKKVNKFADAKGPRSLVVHDLTAIAAEALPSDVRPRSTALTAYLLSSSGQGPSLEIFQVPSGVVTFVAMAAGASTRAAWAAVTARFRPVSEQEEDTDSGAKKVRAKKKAPIAGRPGWSRNPAFEELSAIFAGGFTDRALATKWLRVHVLGRLEREGKRAMYRESESRSWALAALFMTEVLGMKKARVEAIRHFSDKLATWIHQKRDKRLLNALAFDKLSELQHALRRIQRESTASKLLFGLEEYRDVWLHEDGDAYLVRDLICIRVVESLYDLGYFKEHPEDVLTAPEGEASPQEGALQ